MDEKTDARGDRLSARIPILAVMLVVLTAVATAVMVAPTLSESHDQRAAAARPAAAVPAPAPVAMVNAPPLDSPASTNQQGAGPACRDCGVIESVVALAPRARDDSVAYQMRIRMDDGSLRTVAQRGALAAGSRVMVAGRSVRPVAARPGPG